MMNTLQRRLVTYFTDLSPRFLQRTGITTEKMSPKKAMLKGQSQLVNLLLEMKTTSINFLNA